MVTRREFLKTFGPIAGFLAMAAGPGAVAVAMGEPGRRDGEYEPVGYLGPDTPGYMDVAFITLNGERVERVHRLNDAEGWLEHYGPLPHGSISPIRLFYRKGVVRVHWYPSRR